MTSHFLDALKNARGEIGEKPFTIFTALYASYYKQVIPQILTVAQLDVIFMTLLTLVKKEVASPTKFQSFHTHEMAPIDYYGFGLDFLRPLVDMSRSQVLGIKNVTKIEQQLSQGENVILFANHQTEVDPQLISLALEKSHNAVGRDLIFVAGDRVITDPMAIPFSKGRNLLCIYSKRHIDNPPEKKSEKQQHNQKTMRVMREMLRTGGQAIYVAPAGGRDRPSSTGEVGPSPFDPNNIEMFRLMAEQAEKKTHFYPLALLTFDILPPPSSIENAVGEMRDVKFDAIFLSFGNELDLNALLEKMPFEKLERRAALAAHIFAVVNEDYQKLMTLKKQGNP